MNRSSLLPGLVLLAALGLPACDTEPDTASLRSERSTTVSEPAAEAPTEAPATTSPPVPVQRLVPPPTTRPPAPPSPRPRATTAAPVVRTTPRRVVTTAPKPVATTKKATVAAASTCGAPSNPWGYNFCGRGSVINNPPSAFCDYFDCIPSFWESTNGYVMQCDDLMFSHSGGRSGSCSHHGGNYRALSG